MHYERGNNNRFHNVEFNQFWHSLMHVWIKGADRPTTYACSCHDHLVPRTIFVEGFTITGIMEFAGRFLAVECDLPLQRSVVSGYSTESLGLCHTCRI